MQYVITETDKLLIQQNNIKSKIKISILSNDKKILGVLTGIAQIGTYTIDADSDIRRTASLDLQLDNYDSSIERILKSYLALDFLFEIGIYNERTLEYKYYQMGILCITTANTSYNVNSNILSINLSDKFAKLDGTRNGQIGGAPTITIPTENEDGTKNTLRSSLISIIKSETNIKDYIIDDVGEYYGMPQNNNNYLEYRKVNPNWNIIPYDLSFSAGNTVAELMTDIRDLYPNCQLYFDIYDNFCFNMIPSNNNAPISLSNEYLQSIITANESENVQYDISSIKNIVEVFGKTYDIDRFCQNSNLTQNIYNLSIDLYESYKSNQYISFEATASNPDSPCININNLGNIPLYYEYTNNFIKRNTISAGDTIAIKLSRNPNGNYICYYLGQYQPHALCVLTNNLNDTVYTKQYFAKRYNCLEKNIAFVEIPNGEFTIQKIGLILDSKSGDEFDNIISDTVALDNAKYLIYKSSVWNDTVTITTKLCPWLDVNMKVEYKKQQEDKPYIYLIKKISHEFVNGTSTITMYRFSSLYQE